MNYIKTTSLSTLLWVVLAGSPLQTQVFPWSVSVLVYHQVSYFSPCLVLSASPHTHLASFTVTQVKVSLVKVSPESPG